MNPGLAEFRNLFQMYPLMDLFSPFGGPFYGVFTITNSNLLLLKQIVLKH